MERRIRDRLEGAVAATGGGREGVATALLVGFDAAAKLKVQRILSESPAGVTEDTLTRALVELISPAPAAAAAILLGAWRAALASASAGEPVAEVRTGLAWALASQHA